MTDLELLEYAAKAAGIAIRRGNTYQSDTFFVDAPRPDGVFTGREWNPITDDGDALRLAVKLGVPASYNGADYAAANKDPYAATRRAIVRAAAEIGKAMK